jgi:hypothetical protein
VIHLHRRLRLRCRNARHCHKVVDFAQCYFQAGGIVTHFTALPRVQLPSDFCGLGVDNLSWKTQAAILLRRVFRRSRIVPTLVGIARGALTAGDKHRLRNIYHAPPLSGIPVCGGDHRLADGKLEKGQQG